MLSDSSRPSIAPHPQFAFEDALDIVEYIILARSPHTTTALDSGALILLGTTPIHATDSSLLFALDPARAEDLFVLGASAPQRHSALR